MSYHSLSNPLAASSFYNYMSTPSASIGPPWLVSPQQPPPPDIAGTDKLSTTTSSGSLAASYRNQVKREREAAATTCDFDGSVYSNQPRQEYHHPCQVDGAHLTKMHGLHAPNSAAESASELRAAKQPRYSDAATPTASLLYAANGCGFYSPPLTATMSHHRQQQPSREECEAAMPASPSSFSVSLSSSSSSTTESTFSRHNLPITAAVSSTGEILFQPFFSF